MRLSAPALFAITSALTLALSGCGGTPKESSDGTGDSSSNDSYTSAEDVDGDGYVPESGGGNDCDDQNADIHPDRAEDCNGIDDNCNGVVDEGLADADSDGTADCADTESCDGVDNDGDGDVDEDYADADGDGVADCVGTERCDGIDNNENGQIDEGYDADGDGYTQCGSDDEAADCDDGDAGVHPDGTEAASDQVDNDCDGLIDEGTYRENDLTITEIMNNPGMVADPLGEYFELYNTTDADILLNGMVISDSGGEEHVITSDSLLIVEPGEFFLLAANGDPAVNGDMEVGYVYEGITLSNESDDLMLYAGTTLLDGVTWDDGASMPDPEAASMGTDSGGYDAFLNDDPGYWCVATESWTSSDADDKGSPGAPNEYCSTVDHDGDGFNGDEGDCDDGDATTYPGANEGSDPADNDCDGTAETAPIASSTATSSGYSCDDISLDGTASYDLEGMALTYTWELTGAPAGSSRTSADINTTTSAAPTFEPDVAGTYTFSLTVNDGGTDSTPASVSVTVSDRPTNSDPTANAGSDQSYSGSVTCSSSSYGRVHTCDDCSDYDFTLSGTGSSDADGDSLTYAWLVQSGSYATLSSTTGSSVTLTVSGVPATYGSTTTDLTVVKLTVTDCMGATSMADFVNVTYACTGS